MTLGTAAILGLGSVAGAVVQGRAAGKAADAQADAANQANETERYIFDRSVELTEPQRIMGQNALAALGYEAGIAPLPTFGGTSGNALSGGTTIDGMAIEEIPGSGGLDFRRVGGEGQFDAFKDGIRIGGGNSQADRDRLTAMYGGQGDGSFRVGNRTFGTREEAQAYIDSQMGGAAGAAGGGESGGMEYTPISFPDLPNLPDAPDTSLEAFEAAPGYQFRLDEGMKAIERAAAARGLRLSGGALKDSARFAGGLASGEYGNFYGRQMDRYNIDRQNIMDDYRLGYGAAMDSRNLLASLAGLGQQAIQSQIGAGNQYAAGTSANLTNMGNALAGGYMGRADAVTSGINNLSNIYGMGMSGYLGQNPGLGIKPLANPFGG